MPASQPQIGTPAATGPGGLECRARIGGDFNSEDIHLMKHNVRDECVKKFYNNHLPLYD